MYVCIKIPIVIGPTTKDPFESLQELLRSSCDPVTQFFAWKSLNQGRTCQLNVFLEDFVFQ